ncbi:MAG: efflux RND transporter permease subunit [Bacteroidales bacterium]|nr:efflux RND transporter permease subunit [Bacteroidales bacterium]
MIKFLLDRPIAVLMAFTAFFIVGWVTYFSIPVSLLPDIAIPEITVQVTGKNSSARELENTMVKPVRLQLMQVSGLRNITSETRDGSAVIRLDFDYGTNTDLAFIEVNEKIDAAMSLLSRDIERPRVVKASASDIPVFYLNLTLKNDKPYIRNDESDFLELSEFAETVIKRSIEQLPEVAMADMTGVLKKEVRVIPDEAKLNMLGLTLKDIEETLVGNNVEPGSMLIRDGYYEYNIRFSSILRTPDDVRNIYIKKKGRVFQLGDLAEIEIIPQKEKGLSLSNGKQAVTLAIIKQTDENMDDLQDALSGVIGHFQKIYPDIEFSVSRNQTELLDYTVSNLKQNLLLGFIFICFIAFLFLGDVKSPVIIGLSMVVSIVVCFLFFYLFQMSLNIISLSGLILALGMMIDSSVIVTENITQYRERGLSLEEACIKGTNEVITPMLSSSLTTIAVFVPLVFMSGIAGAIFYDQAFSVTVGLFVSYFTGIMLLPVLYRLVYGIKSSPVRKKLPKRFSFLQSCFLERCYDAGINFTFRHKFTNILLIVIAFPLCVLFFIVIPKERMPHIDQNEMEIAVDWNENIQLSENRNRINELLVRIDSFTLTHDALLGQTQFLLNRDRELSSSEAALYVKTPTPSGIEPLRKLIGKWSDENYPRSTVTFQPPVTVFEKVFVTGEADLTVQLYAENGHQSHDVEVIRNITGLLSESGEKPANIVFDKQINIAVDREKLLLYNVSYDEVYRALKTLFRENQVATLRSFQQYLPIVLSGKENRMDDLLKTTFIRMNTDKEGEHPEIPLSALIKVTSAYDLKVITAGKNGEYLPFNFDKVRDPEYVESVIRENIDKTDGWTVDFSGSWYSNRQMLMELVVILFISVLLMYFILAAQFESFLQPLVVLLEIPVDIAAALLLLWICGHSLNLMSAIGIVVTCGIIINDSILKIDAINELRKAGMPLLDAIHEAGKRRLRPILMTSLTTIFAMVPLLFSFDMGSELQKPLSIAMIGAMVVGTLVSLFIIPLIYWFIYRGKEQSF